MTEGASAVYWNRIYFIEFLYKTLYACTKTFVPYDVIYGEDCIATFFSNHPFFYYNANQIDCWKLF